MGLVREIMRFFVGVILFIPYLILTFLNSYWRKNNENTTNKKNRYGDI